MDAGDVGAPGGAAADSGEGAGADVPTWHQHVRPLVESYCGDCHREGGVAPMPLERYEHLVTYEAAVQDAVTSRRMPPWQAAPGKQAYRFDESLPDAAADLLHRWYAAGAPEGDPARPGAAVIRDRSHLSRTDATFRMPEPYVPRTGTDDYRCFPFDWTFEEDRFVTGFAVAPTNAEVAHHAVAFLFRPADAARVDAMDAADPGPGYACYGAPYVGTPTVSQFLGAWAPGGTGFDLPPGTGIHVRPGSRVVLQMHYSAHGGTPAPDQTELRFSLAPSVDRQAWYLPWLDMNWVLRPDGMLIPAGETDVRHEFTARPSEAQVVRFILPDVETGTGFTLHTVAPHMHEHGLSQQVDLLREDGTEVPLLDVPRWDFDWQRMYFFAEPLRVEPGDRLRLRCTWDNTERTQRLVDGRPAPIQDLRWGEGTEDEMCAAMMLMTLD